MPIGPFSINTFDCTLHQIWFQCLHHNITFVLQMKTLSDSYGIYTILESLLTEKVFFCLVFCHFGSYLVLEGVQFMSAKLAWCVLCGWCLVNILLHIQKFSCFHAFLYDWCNPIILPHQLLHLLTNFYDEKLWGNNIIIANCL